MEAVVTTGAIRYVKSSPPTNQHPAFYRPDALPVTQPTVPKALNHITWICLPQALPGSSNILLMNYSCFWHPYFGKFVRVTKFNKSAAFSQYIVNIQHYVYLKKYIMCSILDCWGLAWCRTDAQQAGTCPGCRNLYHTATEIGYFNRLNSRTGNLVNYNT